MKYCYVMSLVGSNLLLANFYVIYQHKIVVDNNILGMNRRTEEYIKNMNRRTEEHISAIKRNN